MLQLNQKNVNQSKSCFTIQKNMRFQKTNLLICTCLLLSFCSVYAQKKKSIVPTAIDFRSDIQIDGDLSEWGDSLRNYYEKQDLQYEIANDEKQIYVAMRVKDGSWQTQALHQGFSFLVNKEGKKKEGASIIFPIPDRESLRSLASKDKDEKPADIREGILKAVRAIFIVGMADVVDGPISLENNYGIKAAVKIDSSDAVCYEAVIPFERIGLEQERDKEVAFNIKINGIVMRTVGGGQPMGRYGYGGYGYYGTQPSRKETQQEPGTWIILPLAKPK
uniref:Uncharacterized protein n=1 Tax=Sphingobacterium sp. (strain 21) TaxID=743722 RepID=F4CDK0_SPHS2